MVGVLGVGVGVRSISTSSTMLVRSRLGSGLVVFRMWGRLGAIRHIRLGRWLGLLGLLRGRFLPRLLSSFFGSILLCLRGCILLVFVLLF